MYETDFLCENAPERTVSGINDPFMKLKTLLTLFIVLTTSFAEDAPSCCKSEPRLERISYFSDVMQKERDYFVYLPAGYESRTDWPVILFLHGNGERGNGKDELDYVLKHGPLFEAWSQKKDLPFIIISPQLPMFDMGQVSYIANRTRAEIPLRLKEGIHPSPPHYVGEDKMEGKTTCNSPLPPEGPPQGWPILEKELIAMLDHVIGEYKTDSHRVYLTGISYGGFGTWANTPNDSLRYARSWVMRIPISRHRLPKANSRCGFLREVGITPSRLIISTRSLTDSKN
jgi:hypothetical protein